MDIKLTGANIRPEGSSPSSVKPRSQTGESGPATPRTGAAIDEPVTLTQTARTLSAALGSAGKVPFDSAKVAEIKAAVSEGRYAINYQRLAESLLESEG